MNFIRKHFRAISFISLGVVIVITVLSCFELRKTKFDYEFESFFPVDDPDLDVYHDFRNKFEYDNEFVLLAIENHNGIFREDFLEHVQALTDSLRNIPDITQVISPTDMTYLTTTGSYPYLHVDEPEKYRSDSVHIYHSKELVNSFFPPNAKSVSIFIRTSNGISKEKSDRVLVRMEKEIGRYHFDKIHLASKLNGQKVYLDRLQHEFVIFFIASFILVITFLYISFRSFWGVWVPVLIVVLAIVWTLALMTASGKSLDIMTVLLPTMMFVVGMSDVVHIVTKYLEELRTGINRFDALIKTIQDVGFATFITLITTGLGFLTLLNSHIIPIRDFGLYTSIGVFIAFVLAFTIMPVTLNVIREPNLKLEGQSSYFWHKRLHAMLAWIFRNGKAITVVTVLLTVASIWGITRISLNNYLIEGLTTRDELRKDFNFFEENYSGVRPFELVVKASRKDHSLLGVDELRAMDKLENYLEKKYGIGFIVSPLTMVKSVNKAQHDGNPDFFTLPKDSADIADLVDVLGNNKKRKEARLYLAEGDSVGRVSGKMHDVGSKIIRAKNAELDTFLAHEPGMAAIRVHRTGAAVMLDKNNEYLVTNTLQGLFFSVFVVGLIIGIIHRSFKMAVIAIIPNFLPILFIGGLMGFTAIDLKSSTSIIFSIAFGIATDDTVHFLGRLKLEMKHGLPVLYALKRTYLSTGKAVVVTSLILSAGFMTLIASSFESTFYFGMLVSITLLVAVLTDLLLFPLLALWLVKKES